MAIKFIATANFLYTWVLFVTLCCLCVWHEQLVIPGGGTGVGFGLLDLYAWKRVWRIRMSWPQDLRYSLVHLSTLFAAVAGPLSD